MTIYIITDTVIKSRKNIQRFSKCEYNILCVIMPYKFSKKMLHKRMINIWFTRNGTGPINIKNVP